MKAYFLPLFITFFAISINARPAVNNEGMQLCNADFNVPPSGNCTGHYVQFSDLSTAATGYITTWEWNFGDGSPILVINYPPSPTVYHLFPVSALSFQVTLTITTSQGCNNSKVKLVSLSPAPIAEFMFPPTSNCAGQTVPFTDLSQTNGGGSIVAWEWNFGDPGSGSGNNSTLQNPVHMFTAPGTFTVSLIVTNINGCKDTIYKSVPINAAPVPAISGPQTVCAGTSSHVYTTEAGMNNYLWTVSSGGTITGGGGTGNNSVTVTWNQAGTQTVSVNYSNSAGCPAVSPTVFNVLVNSLPAATITPGGPTTFCQGGSVTLTAGAAYSYLWNNGATTQSITVTASGSYSVTVTNANACSSTSLPVQVTVNPNPVANAGTDQNIAYGATTGLSGSASGGSGNYSWHWEPASYLVNPNIQNPVTVNLTASIQFTLTVTDMINTCAGNDQVLVTVTGGPLSVDATADPDSVCPGNAVQLTAISSGGNGNNTYSWTSVPPGFTSGIYNPVTYPFNTTRYFVTVSDGYGSVTDSVSVGVLPLPGIPQAPAGPDTVDLKTVINTDYITAGGVSANSYTWDISPYNAGTISGSGTTGTVAWSANFLGTAVITVKAANSCGESSWSSGKTTFVENSLTGIDEELNQTEHVIYPNPSTGSFHISLGTKSDLSVFTVSGIMVAFIQDFITGSIDLGHCPKGIYILLIESPGQKAIREKIVIL